MDRESDLSAKDKIALKGIARTEKERNTVQVTEINKLQKDIKAALYTSGSIKGVTDPVTKEVTYTDSDSNQQALIAEVTSQLNFANKQENKDLKGIRTLTALLKRLKGPQPEANQTEVKSIGMDKAIEILKQNPTPKRIQQFISSYGKENLPAGLENKTENKKDNIIKTDKTRQIDSEGNAPPKPPSSFLTKPKEKAAREEWDKLYGNDFYPNGRPKPKKK